MTAGDHLHGAYQEWRRLAETEGEAIRASNWPLVNHCQDSLQALQTDIIRWSGEARQEWVRLGLDVSSQENRVRTVVGELIEVERRNSASLNEVRLAARDQFQQLEQSGHQLRQVQRSYAPNRAPVWTSFS